MKPNMDISTPEGLANAVEWQIDHVARIMQGGIWAVPRSLSAYRIDHINRAAVKLCGYPEPNILKVFQAMGWKVHAEPGVEL